VYKPPNLPNTRVICLPPSLIPGLYASQDPKNGVYMPLMTLRTVYICPLSVHTRVYATLSTHPGIHHGTPPRVHHPTTVHGTRHPSCRHRYRLTALTRKVAERTVSDEAVTDTRVTNHPLHCWSLFR